MDGGLIPRNTGVTQSNPESKSVGTAWTATDCWRPTENEDLCFVPNQRYECCCEEPSEKRTAFSATRSTARGCYDHRPDRQRAFRPPLGNRGLGTSNRATELAQDASGGRLVQGGGMVGVVSRRTVIFRDASAPHVCGPRDKLVKPNGFALYRAASAVRRAPLSGEVYVAPKALRLLPSVKERFWERLATKNILRDGGRSDCGCQKQIDSIVRGSAFAS